MSCEAMSSVHHPDGNRWFNQVYKREPSKRVFVNRSLLLEKVKFFGFDMDYTLAMYSSPEYETMGFDLLKQKLVEMGYPNDINDFEYDPSFPIRGLWFDQRFGTLLKVDGFGNILVCVRGFHFMRGSEIQRLYPTKFVRLDENRFRIFNTLYELPLIYILACLIDYFTNNVSYVKIDTGVKSGDVTMNYNSIYNDVDEAMSYVHDGQGPLKTNTVNDVAKYVVKDDNLPILLTRLRDNGKKVFLATNSDYKYTNKIMTYMFDTPTNPDKKEWVTFFDFVVVDAKKPVFFSQGTALREVNRETGGLHLGTFTGPLRTGSIYSGGSVDLLNEMMGTEDSEVLYVGDHIFGDILKSKKKRGWKTFLVVPEIVQELTVWTKKSHTFKQLSNYDSQIAEIYRNLDSSDKSCPDISEIQCKIRETTHDMDQAYGKLGSVFRSGSRQTFFASQVMRYADLYGPSFMNMLHYPLGYCFRAPAMLMPHESTVDHNCTITEESMRHISMAWRSIATSRDKTSRKGKTSGSVDSNICRRYCKQPRLLTEVADDFLEDRSAAEVDSVSDEED